jgi:hypothetical protein
MDPYFKISFCFNSKYTSVKRDLTMHPKTMVIYAIYLRLRLLKINIYYDLYLILINILM